MVRLLCALGLALLALSVPAAAQADCACQKPELERELKQAELVFVGSVTSVRETDNRVLYDVTATTLYKGQLPEAQLQVAVGLVVIQECGVELLTEGKVRLFVVSGDSPYRIGCSGAYRISPAALKAVAAQDLQGRDIAAPEDTPEATPPSEALLRKLAAPDAPALPELLAVPAGLALGGLVAISLAGFVGRRRR